MKTAAFIGLVRWYGLVVVSILMGICSPMVAGAIEISGLEGQAKMDHSEGRTKTIVLIGASYAGGWPSERPIGGYRMVNKGVSGQQSFEMLARFESDVLVLKPDAVIIWGFINDIFRSDRAQIDQTLRRTRESIVAMIKLTRKAGITPILATEVTIRGKNEWSETLQAFIGRILGKASYQDYVNEHVIETNRGIRELATREGLLLLDFESVLADQQGVRQQAFSQPDGSHISRQGYDALIRYAEAQLKAPLGTR